MGPLPDRHIHHARSTRLLVVVTLGMVAVLSWSALPASAATTSGAGPRMFSCTGGLGEPFTYRTVTGELTASNVPRAVVVTQTATGVVDSRQGGRAALVGPSWLHSGYTEWDVTGHNRDGDVFHLSTPPVLPGGGGFFDADLYIEFGAGGNWQIPMFDCAVNGGPPRLATPSGQRHFTCIGGLGEAFTFRTVNGRLTSHNLPGDVTVVETSSGTIDSSRPRLARSRGPSPLHAGYTEWDVTGHNPNGDLFFLSLPPVLPGVGGYFDADLDIEFAGGANGSWQIPMFDCAVN